MQTRYHRLQGLSQNKGQVVRPRTATWPTAPDPASQHGRASEVPCVPQLQTPPPSSGGLRCCHTIRNSGLHHPPREGSGAATCFAAPDPASQLGRAPVLPHGLQLWTPPPSTEGLRCCCVFRNSRPRLPAREGSGAATHSAAPDSATHHRRALVLLRVPRLRTPPPSSGGPRCCHISHGSQRAVVRE
jgi:hypothetical protein